MTQMSTRGRVFVLCLSIFAGGGTLTGLWLEKQLVHELTQAIEERLTEHARAGVTLWEHLPREASIETVDPLIKRLGEAVNSRMTAIRTQGQVDRAHEVDNYLSRRQNSQLICERSLFLALCPNQVISTAFQHSHH